jgi:hypothetical protein
MNDTDKQGCGETVDPFDLKSNSARSESSTLSSPTKFMKLIVYHSWYGCETGCCGHIVESTENSDHKLLHKFHFDHPSGDDFKKFAEDLVRNQYGEKHVKDLDWENCKIVDD